MDYAELNDWAAINLHFRRGADRFDINHAWLCLRSKTLPRVRAPWREWAEAGKITMVDDVSINPDLLAAYIRDAAGKYNVRALAMDHFRWTLVSESMRAIGFDAADKNRVKLVRPSDIMQVEPVIQECFDRELFYWDDMPQLRWAVNNTKRVRSSQAGRRHRKLYLRQDRSQKPQDGPLYGACRLDDDRAAAGDRTSACRADDGRDPTLTQGEICDGT
ncbi:MAG: hypothetical protein ACLSHJ_06745 [Oscillospiraceae bacterium]